MAAIIEAKTQRLELEHKQEDARKRSIKSELEWVKSNQKGRHAKSKARLQRFDDLNSQEAQKRNETMEIYIPPGPRLGDIAIELTHISKQFREKLLSRTNRLLPTNIVKVARQQIITGTRKRP